MRWRYILVMIVIYAVYLLIGMSVFYALEFTHEKDTCATTISEIEKAFAKVNSSATRSLTGEDLRNLIKLIREAPSNGVQFNNNQTPSCAHNWNLQNAFFFAGTVATTIGYGNISPNTTGGQSFCIFYAFVGIPFFGIMFSAIGDKIAKVFKKLDKKLESKTKRRLARRLIVIVITLTSLFLFCCIIPSFIFVAVEGWTYHIAFYYSFITLTTIGFGDYVVGTNPDLTYPTIYRPMVYFWILFGLAYMATVISLASEAIKERGTVFLYNRHLTVTNFNDKHVENNEKSYWPFLPATKKLKKDDTEQTENGVVADALPITSEAADASEAKPQQNNESKEETVDL